MLAGEIKVTLSINAKRMKQGLREAGLAVAFLGFAIAMQLLREAIDNLVEELKEGDQNE